MDPITDLFDRLDAWRHFPNYQLERRADIFFALYLPEVLESTLGIAINPRLAPEFPVRIGTIYPDIPIDKSYKIDYLAISADGQQPILVELKTEGFSRRASQDKYLLAARSVGLPALLDGLITIFRATNAKRKYYCLLVQLEQMGLLRLPDAFKTIMARPALIGATEASHGIAITAPATEPIIVYVQPKGDDPGIISFERFRAVVERHPDPISQRFAQSLAEWGRIQAGDVQANDAPHD